MENTKLSVETRDADHANASEIVRARGTEEQTTNDLGREETRAVTGVSAAARIAERVNAMKITRVFAALRLSNTTRQKHRSGVALQPSALFVYVMAVHESAE